MGAGARALPADEVAVRGRGAAFLRRDEIAVHGGAHRAARFAPLEARVAEDAVEALGFGRALDRRGARHDHRGHDGLAAFSTAAAARRSSIRLLVQEPMKTRSMGTSGERQCRAPGPCSSAPLATHCRACGIGLARDRGRPLIGKVSSGLVPQVTMGSIARRRSRLRGRNARRRRSATCASRQARRPNPLRRAQTAGRADSRRWCRPARPCRSGRPPRSTCCRPSAAASIDIARSPARHTRWRGRRRPPAPIWPMIARITSLAVTPGRQLPLTVMRMVLGATATASGSP